MRTRILIIDDEPDITFDFKKALRDKGFAQVETANDSILALKNFKADLYDLLIIDCNARNGWIQPIRRN